MIDRKELDKIEEEKKKVQVRIVLPNLQTYRKHSTKFKELTEEANGRMSVKMI